MKIFRVTFLLNAIASIKESEIDPDFESEIQFYENQGLKIFALVKAMNETDARNKIELVLGNDNKQGLFTSKQNTGSLGRSEDYIL